MPRFASLSLLFFILNLSSMATAPLEWSAFHRENWHKLSSENDELYLLPNDPFPLAPQSDAYYPINNIIPQSWYLLEAPPEENIDLLAVPLNKLKNVSLGSFSLYTEDGITQTDDDLYYFSRLVRTTIFPKKTRNDNHIFSFISGPKNLVEIFVDGKKIAASHHILYLSGKDFPADAKHLCIRTRSTDKNNTGIIAINAYKKMEEFSLKPNGPWRRLYQEEFNHLPQQNKYYSRQNFLVKPNPEAIFYLKKRSDIDDIKINGHEINIFSKPISNRILKPGKNTLTYSRERPQLGINDNIQFKAHKRIKLKTVANATVDSGLILNLRGATASIAINGIPAGQTSPTQDNIVIGKGLFKDGENNIEIIAECFSAKAAIVKSEITTEDLFPAVLNWNDQELRSAPNNGYSHIGSLIEAEIGKTINADFYLVKTDALNLKFYETNSPASLQNNGLVGSPRTIAINGQELNSTSKTFRIPANLLQKGKNTISFVAKHQFTPEAFFVDDKKARTRTTSLPLKSTTPWRAPLAQNLDLRDHFLWRSSSLNNIITTQLSWFFPQQPLAGFGTFPALKPRSKKDLHWLAISTHHKEISQSGLAYQEILIANRTRTPVPKCFLPAIATDDESLANLPGNMIDFLLHLQKAGHDCNWRLTSPEEIIAYHGEKAWQNYLEAKKQKLTEAMKENIKSSLPATEIVQ